MTPTALHSTPRRARRAAGADPRRRLRAPQARARRGGAGRAGDAARHDRDRRHRRGDPRFTPSTQMLPGHAGPPASHRRLDGRGALRGRLSVDAPRGSPPARARQGVRRVGVADGRRRALRALAARRSPSSRAGTSWPRRRCVACSVLLVRRRGHVRPEGRADRALDAGTAALAGSLHRGDRHVPARQRAGARDASSRCGGSSGPCSASFSSSPSARRRTRSGWPTAPDRVLRGALVRAVRHRCAPHREDRVPQDRSDPLDRGNSGACGGRCRISDSGRRPRCSGRRRPGRSRAAASRHGEPAS